MSGACPHRRPRFREWRRERPARRPRAVHLVRRPQGGRSVQPPAAARRPLRPDRPQRRGQDHRLQPAHRRLHARRRHDPRSTASAIAASGRTRSPRPAWRGRSRTSACSATCPCSTTCASAADCGSRTALRGTVLRHAGTSPPSRRRDRRERRELLDIFGLATARTSRRRNLRYGDQRRLEIARALATQPGPPARRTRRRHEPAGKDRADGAHPLHPRPSSARHPADRARHEAGDEHLRADHRPRPRRDDRRRHAGGGAGESEGDRGVPGRGRRSGRPNRWSAFGT